MVQVERDAYKSIVVMCKNQEITISENDKITFVSDFTGEKKVGILTKISGKGEKTKLQIIPDGSQYEEVWPIIIIKEDTLVYAEEEE